MAEENRVNQNDVAKRAGVSRSVVSYVLNNGPRKVAKETRQRVLRAIEELGYRPNEHAQRLKQGQDFASNSIGILTGGEGYDIMERPYYNILLSELYQQAYDHNQQISFLAYWNAMKDPIFFNKHIHTQEISSLILILPSYIPDDEDNQALLTETIERIPNIICLEETVRNLPAVTFDRAQAARTVMEHLISLGHRKIAFIGINDGRLTGYKHSLFEHHIPYKEELVDFISTAKSPYTSAYEITMNLLDSGVEFSAICTATDEAAIGTIAALTDRGLTVPDDIALASIDNLEVSGMIRPALTTVDIPTRTLAKHTIQALQTQKEYGMDSPVSMVVPTKLIVRESCGSK